MKVLLGDTRSYTNLEILQRRGWGRMCVTKTPKPYPFECWGFDNGAFPAFLRGQAFPADAYRYRLEKALAVNSDPYFAVAPDIVAGGLKSLDFSVSWLLNLPTHWRWYLAVQDGMDFESVERVLHLFHGIFLGGSDRFKLTAYSWCQFAHANQKNFHYARAGTLRKLRHAYAIGSDSLDSSFPLWSRDRMKLFGHWVDGLAEQTNFGFAERCTTLQGVAGCAENLRVIS